jgi:hypothetical protein
MMYYSKLVSHWLPPQSVPVAVLPVVEALHKKGIKVCRVGLENPKAPMHYVFVDQPFDARAVLAELCETEGLSTAPNGSGINSYEYVWVGFEAGICTPA